MATFIFTGSLTEEDLKYMEESEDLRPPEAVLGLTPEEVRRLTLEDVKYLITSAKSRAEKPPVFIDRNKIRWYEYEENDRDGFKHFVYADREEIMKLPAFNAVSADVRPVLRGEWQETNAFPHWVCCSICHRRLVPNKEWVKIYNIPTRFCPSCGAEMRNPRRRS